MEFLDVINEEDEVVGRDLRSNIHESGLWHRGAHVLLFTDDDKLLVQQRSRNKSQSPLALDCSVSEHVTVGEDYLHAATRGLSEELGLTNIELTPITKFKMNYGLNDNEISMIFKGTANLEHIRFDKDEIERVDAYSIEDLQTLMQQNPDEFSYWFEQILLWLLDKPSTLQIMDNG